MNRNFSLLVLVAVLAVSPIVGCGGPRDTTIKVSQSDIEAYEAEVEKTRLEDEKASKERKPGGQI
tara:strand:- start:34 stop:228 length:195 start_codon:yes stop_codon:yes gene_type:complete